MMKMGEIKGRGRQKDEKAKISIVSIEFPLGY